MNTASTKFSLLWRITLEADHAGFYKLLLKSTMIEYIRDRVHLLAR